MNQSQHEAKTVSRYFHETCGKFPSRPAQRYNSSLYNGDNNGRFTYNEMSVRVEQIACGLLSLGLNPGDRVAFMSRPSPYLTQVDMAISGCAAASVVLHPALSMSEAQRILGDTASRFLIVDTQQALAGVIPLFETLPGLEKIIVQDVAYRKSDETTLGLWELMERGKTWGAANPQAYAQRSQAAGLDDPYTILYPLETDGRGVVLTHRCVSSRLEGMKAFFSEHRMEISQDDVTLVCLPVSQIFERVSSELLSLCTGACIAYADGPATLLNDMQKYNPTWISSGTVLCEQGFSAVRDSLNTTFLKKSLFGLALAAGREALEYRRDHRGWYTMVEGYDLEKRLPPFLKMRFRLAERLFARARALFGLRFRFALAAGTGMDPEVLRFFSTLSLAVVECHSRPESAGACIMNPINACRPGFVGIEANGSSARIAENGELELFGAGIFSGYLNLPEDTKASITGDGWFRTGCSAERDTYGYFRIIKESKAR